MKTPLRITVLAFAALAASAFAQDSFTYKPKVKVGQVSRYAMKATFSFTGGEGTLEAKMESKVTKIDEKGNVTSESKVDGKVSVMGQEFPMNEGGGTSTVSPLNDLLEVNGADQNEDNIALEFRAHRLQQVHWIDKELKVGDTWSKEFKPSAKDGNVAAKVDYKFEGIETIGGVRCAKIHTSGKETQNGEASVEATSWIDLTTFEMVKYEGSYKNFQTAGAPMPMDLKVTLTRIAG